jgi:hypothetical protein
MTDDDARRGMILNVSDRGARKSAVTAAPRVTGEFQSVVLASLKLEERAHAQAEVDVEAQREDRDAGHDF